MQSADLHTSVTPAVAAILTQLAETPDLDAALRKVLSDYLVLKIGALSTEIRAFEEKWGMTFEEFSERAAAGSLPEDAFSYAVESDSWDWERAVTLLRHYRALEHRWI